MGEGGFDLRSSVKYRSSFRARCSVGEKRRQEQVMMKTDSSFRSRGYRGGMMENEVLVKSCSSSMARVLGGGERGVHRQQKIALLLG